MAETLSEMSDAARVAAIGEGISLEELALAARNHGMPLEALRYDVTPPGLHYLLTHYDIPAIDPSAWRLAVTGLVGRALELDLETLRGFADWTGVSLATVLDEAGADPAAVDVLFTGADHGVERGVEQDYQRSLSLAAARDPDVLLAYAMNGMDLPPQHGHPVRLIVPGWYGMASVKWLVSIEVLDHAFTGYQQSVSYRLRQRHDEDGIPVTRIRPRALVVPPGFPDFMTRHRVVRPGPVEIEGRAWSGDSPVEAVEVSVDDGQDWRSATLEPAGQHRWAWRRWTLDWTATPGSYVIMARARTADGDVQPESPAWTLGGFSNNAAQRVPVVCSHPDGGDRADI